MKLKSFSLNATCPCGFNITCLLFENELVKIILSVCLVIQFDVLKDLCLLNSINYIQIVYL